MVAEDCTSRPVPDAGGSDSDRRHVRTRLFRSGNSLALRIPAGTRLQAGMEMDMLIEGGLRLSADPAAAPRRKFDIAKVAGSAQSLQPIADADRLFDKR